MIEFKLEDAIKLISNTPSVVESMLSGLPDEWLTCRENEDSWNAVEILVHFNHGERTDWVTRTKIILGEGSKEFEPFERESGFEGLNADDVPNLVSEFKELRRQNIAEIVGMNLSEDDYEKKGIHPEFGDVTLRQLLAAWVVHDLGHIQQLSRVLAKQYKEEVGPWVKYMSILND